MAEFTVRRAMDRNTQPGLLLLLPTTFRRFSIRDMQEQFHNAPSAIRNSLMNRSFTGLKIEVITGWTSVQSKVAESRFPTLNVSNCL
jgi:hypothetical protein